MGSRLAEQLGILASYSTLLRQLRRKSVVITAQAPRVLGINDWAWRKVRRYRTGLCDLERGKVVDLLPDRSAEIAAQRLAKLPDRAIPRCYPAPAVIPAASCMAIAETAGGGKALLGRTITAIQGNRSMRITGACVLPSHPAARRLRMVELA